MRKIILALLIVYLVSPQAALAQTAATPSAVKATQTATPSAAFNRFLATLLTRLETALISLERLAQRINLRLIKLGLVDPQQKTLTEKLTKSKTDLQALNVQSRTLSKRQDYILFKNQVMSFNKNLKDIYKLELDLVASMKKQAAATATPTVVVPTQ